jgi:hypothetical protein
VTPWEKKRKKRNFAFNGNAGYYLTRGKGAGVNHVGSFLLELFVGLKQRRPGQSHQTGSGGLENTEGGNEFHEGVNTAGLSRAIKKSVSIETSWKEWGERTDSSTMQLLVLISKTLPPNWWVNRVIASRCSCLCLKA